MFTNESTENLLENFENELVEEVVFVKNNVNIELGESPAPVASKRAFQPTPEIRPVPASRQKVQSLLSMEKDDKNDENEIIQLSSISSDIMKSSQSTSQASPVAIKNISQDSSLHSKKQNTVIVVNEKKKASNKIKVQVYQEPEESAFFVSSHGKWAKNNITVAEVVREDDIESEAPIPNKRPLKTPIAVKPEVQFISEKKKVKKLVKKVSPPSSASTVSSKTSLDSSSEASTSDNTPEIKKKSKSKMRKKEKTKKRKTKRKLSSEDDEEGSVTSRTEDSVSETKLKDPAVIDDNRSIAIYIHNTGTFKYNLILRGPKIKITFYNEDNGKQIGDVLWSKTGTFNEDFYNLFCSWNELLLFDQDFPRMQELYNNVLIFFEMSNSEDVNICWAFLKFFSPNFINVNQKFQLQFFEYQKYNRKMFRSKLKKEDEKKDHLIFEQWQMNRKHYSGILNVTVKSIVLQKPEEPVKESSTDIREILNENVNKKWKKLPGQACKIPSKLIHKITLSDKGSMAVKFSFDGNFLAYTEVTRDQFILHVMKFPELVEAFEMREHTELIHEIDWLKQKSDTGNDHQILTASSDFTAIVWKLEQDNYTYNILPHPTFVYTARFLYNDDLDRTYVATGGRDSTVRIWRSKKKKQGFELAQELKPMSADKNVYVTGLVTRNSDIFYASFSNGLILEWFFKSTSKEYFLHRQLVVEELTGKVITSIDLHPRGNKLYVRCFDFADKDNSNSSIYVLGVPSGLVTQKFNNFPRSSRNESQFGLQSKLKLSPCGTLLFSTDLDNKSIIRYHQLVNGNISSQTAAGDGNFISMKTQMGEKNFISSMDYHLKDFFFAYAIYGRNGGVLICSYEQEPKNPVDDQLVNKLSHEKLRKSIEYKSGMETKSFTDIIRRLDEVFLVPGDFSRKPEKPKESTEDQEDLNDNTFTIDSKRSQTYTISQGPATYTLQKNQNNTYEIQRHYSDDETTISESMN
ncbi:unnamed protein product [Diamesa serratosioi]